MAENSIIFMPCTERKRLNPEPALLGRTLDEGDLVAVAAQWRDRVAAANERRTAASLYCGRGVQEGARAAINCKAKVVFISAGLGLVPADALIPAYGLTVSPGKQDSILSKITNPGVRTADWWLEASEVLNDSSHLKDLVPSEAGALALISLSAAYAALVSSELDKLSDQQIRQIRIFGTDLPRQLPVRLHRQVMPVDDRLDGSDSYLRGTRSDFPQRAMKFYTDMLKDGKIDGDSAAKDARGLSELISKWCRPIVPKRLVQSDAQITAFIERNWVEQKGRSSTMLRHLRDSGYACEQSRFKDLFHGVAKSMAASEQEVLL